MQSINNSFHILCWFIDASTVILAAPGVKGLSGVGERTGGVPGLGVSLGSSSNSGSEFGFQDLRRAALLGAASPASGASPASAASTKILAFTLAAPGVSAISAAPTI